MITSLTFWLVVLAILVGCLWVSVWLRHRAEQREERARLQAIEREFPPRVFNAAPITPQIKRVRQNYAASAHQRWRPGYTRSELFAAARRFVTSLSCFRHHGHEQELPKHHA